MEIQEGNLIKWIWDLWAKFNPIIFRVEEAKTDRIKIAVKIKVLIHVEEEEIKIN